MSCHFLFTFAHLILFIQMHKLNKNCFQNAPLLHLFFAFFSFYFVALYVVKGMESPSNAATDPIPIRIDKKNSPSRRMGQEDKDRETVKQIAKSFTKDSKLLESLEPKKNFLELFAKKLLDNAKFATLVRAGCNEGATELERLLNTYERAINLYQQIMATFLAKWRFISKDIHANLKKIEQISQYKVKKQWELLVNWNELKKHLLDRKGIFGGSPPKRGKQQKKANQTFWEFNNEVKERIKIDIMALIRTKSEDNCTCQPCTEMQEMARNISEINANGENLPTKVRSMIGISPQSSKVIL